MQLLGQARGLRGALAGQVPRAVHEEVALFGADHAVRIHDLEDRGGGEHGALYGARADPDPVVRLDHRVDGDLGAVDAEIDVHHVLAQHAVAHRGAAGDERRDVGAVDADQVSALHGLVERLYGGEAGQLVRELGGGDRGDAGPIGTSLDARHRSELAVARRYAGARLRARDEQERGCNEGGVRLVGARLGRRLDPDLDDVVERQFRQVGVDDLGVAAAEDLEGHRVG